MKWYVLYTRHYHERTVFARVTDKGFQAYLPWGMVWRRAKKGMQKVTTPLFPRYVFVRCYLEMYAHLALISLPGVMRLLEDAEGQLLVVPDEDLQLLRKLTAAGHPIERMGYPAAGKSVEVLHGPLQGITGMLQQESRPALVVPFHALQTCVAVEIMSAQVGPYADEERDVPFVPPSPELAAGR
jgi:transcriptional antiterminator RfaH